ncbi:MAG TPA: OmpH family outer membrane protein [Chthoniobacteraceae bacterium]|jgi:outer membrane protein|nr:OmpH family outer membrane protein [Chthoniobacteraceae bacterium]
MKSNLTLPFLVAALACAPFTASAQNMKIGTVDMKKVFESYYKTKDAEAKINEARNNAKKELEDRMDGAKKLLEEVKKLDEEISKPELSKDSKDQKSKVRSEKAGELQSMDREIREFQQSREKQLQEQSVRMRGGIVEEINKVVGEKVKAENYDLVLDRSGPSLNGVPVILYAKESFDFTPEVVTALNRNKGADAAAAPAAAAAPKTAPAKALDAPASAVRPKRP